MSNGVTFNGIPLKQCSTSEQIKISTTMAMTLNPKLRIIRIADGSLIDSNTLATIESFVKDNDYQLWIEKVDETGKVGIYIEDGEIVQK